MPERGVNGALVPSLSTRHSAGARHVNPAQAFLGTTTKKAFCESERRLS